MSATDSQAFVFEPKFDGSRYLFHFHKKRNHLTSRRISVKTNLYSDRIENVPHFKAIKVPKKLEGTVLDGEVVSSSMALAGKGGVGGILNSKPKRSRKRQKKYGPLRMMVFDI